MKKSFFLFLYFISLSAYPGDENAYIYGNDGTIEGIKYNYLDNVIKFNIGVVKSSGCIPKTGLICARLPQCPKRNKW